MYETAIKNKEKPEFRWDSNRNCLDFHLISLDEENECVNHNKYFSGSYCAGEYEWYNEYNEEDRLDQYNLSEFKSEAKRCISQFLNRKNKKEYEVDTIIATMNIELYNYETEDTNYLKLSVQLTFCP